MTIVQTERFFDGTHWEATCPEGWTFRQDKSVDGFPYVFESQGYRLQLGTCRALTPNYGDDITRPDIKSEALRIAYVTTLQQARMTDPIPLAWLFCPLTRYDSALRRHDFAKLSGFTYKARPPVLWAGWFTAEPWSIYAALSGPRERSAQRSEEALAILGSIRFTK